MSIFPSNGVVSIGMFGQPNTPPTAPCINWYGCGVPLDIDALNFTNLELLNILDEEGIAWDCGSNTNLHDAIEAIACRKACEEITDRIFTGVAYNGDNGGNQDVTLPTGGSWDVITVISGSADTTGIGIAGNTVAVSWDDEDDNVGGGNAGNFPGGTTFSVDPHVRGGITLVFAVRVGDC